MRYRSTKTFGHELGLSAAFRQWRADSHCRFIHGYALAVRIEFEAEELDERNWVVDFGGMKTLRARLEDLFDHKLLVAADDPELPLLQTLEERGLASLVVLPAVGCEKFAEYVFALVDRWLRQQQGYDRRVRVHSVEVREHGANSAIYVRGN